jgi:diguanylate cyclase (GGDEF)-like protein
MTTEDKLDLQPVENKMFNKPIFFLAFVTGTIFIAESIVMLILSSLQPMSIFSEALLDSLALIILILPSLYLFMLRPLKLHLAERKRLERKLREASITDELTGLLNRRGFRILSEQQCKVAMRSKCGISLIYTDIDDMKLINDEFGHDEGDQALINTASILKRTFRESDIIGRIGGDEFAVFLTNDSEPNSENIIIKHVLEKLKSFNEENQHKYKLTLSMGIAHENPKHPCPIDTLLTQADKSMYEQKRHKLNS